MRRSTVKRSPGRRIAGESLQRGGYNAVRRYATPGAGARRTGDGPASLGCRMIARSGAIAMVEAVNANGIDRAGFGQERL
jgi:hypothetical protein